MLKHKVLGTALARGLKFEVCYSGLALGDAAARRNLIGNAVSLIRALRGAKRGGVVVASEAKKAAGVRAPMDVVNLGGLWGYGGERGRAGLGSEARAVVVHAQMRRRSWKSVVDVVSQGEVPRVIQKEQGTEKNGKRKAEDESGTRGVETLEKGDERQKQELEQGQGQGRNQKKRRKAKGGPSGGDGGDLNISR